MALTDFQRVLLRVLARNRSPNSVFAGGATLNRGRARWSDDFDIEHTTADAVRAAYLADRDILAENGYEVEELRLAKGIAHARVSAAGGVTILRSRQASKSCQGAHSGQPRSPCSGAKRLLARGSALATPRASGRRTSRA